MPLLVLTAALLLLAIAIVLLLAFHLYPTFVSLFCREQDLWKKYGRCGEWAVVTGASGGIGRLFVERLLSQGFKVLGVSFPDEHARDLETHINSSYPRGVFRSLEVDLAHPGLAERLAEATQGLEVSVVVSNAGAGYAKPFDKLEDEWVESYVASNAAAHACVARFFYARMGKGGGAIVFTSSSMAHMPASHSELYCASKAFVERLALSLAPAAAERGVDVLAVLPGAVVGTRFFDSVPRGVSFLRLFVALGQRPQAVVKTVLRTVGRFGVTTVDSGALGVLMRLADAALSGNGFSGLFRFLVWKLSPLVGDPFADYKSIS